MPSIAKPVVLPKSKSGRQGKPLDQKFVTGMAAAIQKTPTVDGRPALYPSGDTFVTKGKAAADGRRYADAIQELIAEAHPTWKVSVRLDEPTKGQFTWGLYAREIEVSANGSEPETATE